MSQSGTYEEFVQSELSQEKKNSDWAMQQPYVVLVSIDGFRYDYAEKYKAKNILELAKRGASAKKMWPSYPSKTFPNHYTLVTGLLPGHHGIVSNDFYSRSRQEWYHVGDRCVKDGSWYGGTPLWSLAEQQGMLSASLFWVGSEAEIAGERPSYSFEYSDLVPNEYRIRRVLEWLKLPEEKRPHAVFTYFSLVDNAGHRFGPDHDQTREAVLDIDELIGKLYRELFALDLPVYVVLVSDHGMTEVNRGIVINEKVDLKETLVAYSLPAMIYEEDSIRLNELYQNLVKVPNMDVYKSENIPAYLRYSNPDRIGDLVLMPQAPAVTLNNPVKVYGGTHGFNPYTNADMGAIFYAAGPRIQSGQVISPFENIHVYPFLAELLHLQITEPIDGKKAVLDDILSH